MAGILYREATLAEQANPPLAEWLRLAAGTLTANPAANGTALLALVIDGMHSMTECDGCPECALPRPNGPTAN